MNEKNESLVYFEMLKNKKGHYFKMTFFYFSLKMGVYGIIFLSTI